MKNSDASIAVPLFGVIALVGVVAILFYILREASNSPPTSETCQITLTGAATLRLPAGYGLVFDDATDGENAAHVRSCYFRHARPLDAHSELLISAKPSEDDPLTQLELEREMVQNWERLMELEAEMTRRGEVSP